MVTTHLILFFLPIQMNEKEVWCPGTQHQCGPIKSYVANLLRNDRKANKSDKNDFSEAMTEKNLTWKLLV